MMIDQRREGRTQRFYGRLSPDRSRRKARSAWATAKSRCSSRYGSEFRNYTARGIRMCPEWTGSFDAFVAHVGYPILGEVSLDRIDNDGGYVPGNVRWATFEEQQNNRQPGARNKSPVVAPHPLADVFAFGSYRKMSDTLAGLVATKFSIGAPECVTDEWIQKCARAAVDEFLPFVVAALK